MTDWNGSTSGPVWVRMALEAGLNSERVAHIPGRCATQRPGVQEPPLVPSAVHPVSIYVAWIGRDRPASVTVLWESQGAKAPET